MAAASNSRERPDDALADPARRAPRRGRPSSSGGERGARPRVGGQVAEALVEQRRDGVELGLVDRVVAVERDQHLLDGALAQDEDEAGEPVADRDEVEAAEVRGARLGRRGEAGGAGDRGERRGGEAEPVLAGELHLAELVADHQLLDRRAAARRPRSTRRRSGSPASVGTRPARRVRVGQQAVGLELGEDVADGGAGHAEAVALDERLAADRRRGGDVFLDDGPKDRLRAKVQGAEWAAMRRAKGRSPKLVSTLR